MLKRKIALLYQRCIFHSCLIFYIFCFNYIFKHIYSIHLMQKHILYNISWREVEISKNQKFWIWIRGRPLAAISKLSLGNPSKVSSRDRKWSLDHRESDQSSAGSIKTSFKSPELRCQNFASCSLGMNSSDVFVGGNFIF